MLMFTYDRLYFDSHTDHSRNRLLSIRATLNLARCVVIDTKAYAYRSGRWYQVLCYDRFTCSAFSWHYDSEEMHFVYTYGDGVGGYHGLGKGNSEGHTEMYDYRDQFVNTLIDGDDSKISKISRTT